MLSTDVISFFQMVTLLMHHIFQPHLLMTNFTRGLEHVNRETAQEQNIPTGYDEITNIAHRNT